MRITCVIHSLDGGGAEMTMANMVNHWAQAGHDVTLITLDQRNNSRYGVSDDVQWFDLDLMQVSRTLPHALANNWRRLRGIRHAIAESAADVVISFTDQMNVLTILASRRLKIPVIVCQRVDPRHHRPGRIWSWLRKRTYKRSAAVVVQTEEVRAIFEAFTKPAPDPCRTKLPVAKCNP